MPAMPTADDFTILDHTFAQRKSKMGTKILDSVDFSLPLKQCNANAISFYADSEAIRHQFAHGCNP